MLMFNFTLLGSKDFIIKVKSLISYTPGGNVHPIVDPVINFTSNMSTISS